MGRPLRRFVWTGAEINASYCSEGSKWFYGFTFDPLPRIVEIIPANEFFGVGGGYARARPVTRDGWRSALKDIWHTPSLKQRYLRS